MSNRRKGQRSTGEAMMTGQETVHGTETDPNEEIKKSRGEEKIGESILFVQQHTH